MAGVMEAHVCNELGAGLGLALDPAERAFPDLAPRVRALRQTPSPKAGRAALFLLTRIWYATYHRRNELEGTWADAH